MTLLVPQVILLESFLSFLGLGVQEPMTSLGVLISEGAKNIQGATWLLIFPSFYPRHDPVLPQLHRRRPARRARPEGSLTWPNPFFTIRNLDVRFRTRDGIVQAVKGIDLDVEAGETVAIVGESGSGKSQTMMAAMGLLASNGWAEGSVKLSRRGTCRPVARQAQRVSRLEDHHDLPGADDLARSALPDRRPASRCRSPPMAA